MTVLKKFDAKDLGRSDLGWLRSRFHFSFAEYYNPQRMQWGALRVLNDDLIAPGTGFDTHPHRDMEIITYMIDGELTHADSMGNSSTIQRGHVQYMSAGTGVLHAEHNRGSDTTRLLQLWIMPDRIGHTPAYGEYRFEWQARHHQWLPLVSGMAGKAPIQIHQDADLFALELDAGAQMPMEIAPDRQVYLVQIEGTCTVQADSEIAELQMRDALEIRGESLRITAKERCHFLAVNMKQ